MVTSHDLTALDHMISRARDTYAAAVEEAERLLEARRAESSVMVQNSAARVAELEGQLEIFEALENERMAAQVRRELAAEIEQHQANCRRAATMLRAACNQYVKQLTQAVASMTAALQAE